MGPNAISSVLRRERRLDFTDRIREAHVKIEAEGVTDKCHTSRKGKLTLRAKP